MEDQKCKAKLNFYYIILFHCFYSDPPKAPSKPNIIDYDNMSVTLQWEPPTDNGGRPILGYVIEMKDKFTADWIEVIIFF